MQSRVRQRFGALQAMDDADGRVPWKIINAAQTIEQVEADIWEIVRDTVKTCPAEPVQKMWEKGNYNLERKSDEGKKDSSE